jgi:hypothetical protein
MRLPFGKASQSFRQERTIMKITRCLKIAIVLLGLTGVARAITFRVLDPSGPQTDFPAVNVGGANPVITFYEQCFTFDATDPGGCFGVVNTTNNVLTSFEATIDSPITLADSTDSSSICPTDGQGGLPNSFSTVSCSILNNVITIDLSGAPGIQGKSFFYLVETGIPADDFLPDETYGSFSVTAAPEPSSIWMALTGLAPLGYALRRRRGTAKA